MIDETEKGEGQGHAIANNPRQDRLKQALRENLKRRKSQARGRDEKMDASSDHADGSLDDASREEPEA